MRKHRVPPELREWIEIVVEENAADLLRYLQRRVDNPEEAADLLGRVFLLLWESGDRVPRVDEEARMWCFGIARNVLREHHRNTAKSLTLADGLRDYLRATAQQDHAATSPTETWGRAQDVRHAVAFLEERSRELLMLIYWDGFSIAEAARLLSINESTARTRHARALRRLEWTLQKLERDLAESADQSSGRRRSGADLAMGGGQ